MLFNSDTYLFFLPAVVLTNWALPAKARPVFLVFASYYFYAYWNPPYLLLVFGLTLANYAIGRLNGRLQQRSRLLLALAIVIDLGALATFKYLGLMEDSVHRLAQVVGIPATLPVLQVVLPLGLSFFTFEFIHYQVDIQRGQTPIKDPIRFALFPAFFPTQVAGPIKRYEDFDRQVQSLPPFNWERGLEGVELVAIGLFKKVVLADSLIPIVSVVFSDPVHASVLDAIAGMVAFSMQIYLDFSGYTDIGRGSAQLLGYTVPRNFDAPYLATSIRDFWRRWHISLSSWLRDYLYIPLGGSRRSEWRVRLNLMLTMTLGGLWHGAAWHFLVWGFGHGLALVANRAWEATPKLYRPLPPALATALSWGLTQLVVLLLWAEFRAGSIGGALRLWLDVLRPGPGHLLASRQAVYAVGMAGAVLAAQLLLRRWPPRQLAAQIGNAFVLRPTFATALILAAGYVGILRGMTPRFIYFQF